MMRLRPLFTLAIPFALAGCDILNPKFPDAHKILRDEVNRRQLSWKFQAIHHYDYDYQRACLCGSTITQPVTIEVRDDVIQRVENAQGAEILPEQGVSWPTVDSLFVWAEAMLANREAVVEIEFDPNTNHPVRLSADIPSIADEEITHQASSLRVLLTGANDVASYRIGVPFSKSNRVSWRNR
jgi:hypothetical protein